MLCVIRVCGRAVAPCGLTCGWGRAQPMVYLAGDAAGQPRPVAGQQYVVARDGEVIDVVIQNIAANANGAERTRWRARPPVAPGAVGRWGGLCAGVGAQGASVQALPSRND
jgi:hypothetical protein